MNRPNVIQFPPLDPKAVSKVMRDARAVRPVRHVRIESQPTLSEGTAILLGGIAGALVALAIIYALAGGF